MVKALFKAADEDFIYNTFLKATKIEGNLPEFAFH